MIPVTVLTGFLGSGKTTVLNHLLRQPGMEGTAVIVNEFGAVGLDHLLIASPGEQFALLDNGCVCCTVRSDLVETLKDLVSRVASDALPPVNRVLLETTGLADPAPILHTLMIEPELSKQFCIGGVVTTVDAVNGLATLDRHPEAVKQVAIADRLLLTKTDLASPDALARRLHYSNPTAERIVARHGAIDASALLHITPVGSRPDNVLAWLGNHDACDHDHNSHHHGIQSYSFTIAQPVEWSALARWFEYVTALKGAELLRLKGLINVAGSDRPLVVHGVQHVIHPPVRLDAWPSDDRRTRLVFIVRDIPRAAIERTLAKFACIDAGGSDGPPKASAMVRETGRPLEVTP